jgi:hypothetical protein
MDIKKQNLSQFAQDYYGFEMKKNSTAKNPCLTNGKDTIVIKRQKDGNYTFWSPTNQKAKGSVIDFLIWQENVGMSQACKIALQKMGGASQNVNTPKPQQHLDPVKEFDQEKLKQLKVVESHTYLEARGIDNINNDRFKGTVFIDERKNAVFPHTDAAKEITGYAMKNKNFNGFSLGGAKNIWRSNQHDNDTHLVVTESAIDALSYAKLMDKRDAEKMSNTRFISTEGAFSPEVQEIIKKEIASMPENAQVIAAFDNDNQGWKFATELKSTCEEMERKCRIDIPRVKGYDWNDVLVKCLEKEQNIEEEKVPEKEQEASQEGMSCQM